tara:strand:- start:14785 stop:16809 length:2025 start_codon:yes stop_codon:yes gene_type:complete
MNLGGIPFSAWKPDHRPLEYPKEFVKWIDSINSGWQNKIDYEPYNKWQEQAEIWLRDKTDITDFHDVDEQANFIISEYLKCRGNSLYYCNKHGFLKEGDVDGGGVKFDAWEAQKITLFLADCGYNMMIGKARQIGFTSTLGLLAGKRINFNNSYYVKFVTHTKDKGEEIFRDKIKWAFGRVPGYLRNEVYNDAHNMLSLQEKGKKGESGGANSRAEVVTPSVDAINGGQPNLILMDEIGLMDVFTAMMKEGRPALFFYNPKTKQMEMKRQLIAWGTGGEMDKGGAVFEVEFKAAYKAWREKNYNYGIIPLFFDAYAREGMTRDIIEKEKLYYYSVTGVEAERSKVQFHQHYPMSIDDMFLRKSATILPIHEINKHINKIYMLKEGDEPSYGYFQPIYDINEPTPDLFLKYKVTGVEFVKTKGIQDERTTSVIWRHPEENWEFRYYQGTDPINSETGKSKMSTAVWDALAMSPACVVNWRIRSYKECYLQCILAGMYYNVDNRETKDLVESNIGDSYLDFREMHGFERGVVANADLPMSLQGGSAKWWGISNKASTAGRITNRIIEMIELYADNIYIPWFWIQCKTFVEKSLKGTTSHRQSRFQAADLKFDFDDVIFSITYAYINADAHNRFEPRKISGAKSNKVFTKYVQNRETNFQMRLAQVNDKGEVVKYLN